MVNGKKVRLMLSMGLIAFTLLMGGCLQRPPDVLIPDGENTENKVDGKTVIHLVTEDYPPYGFVEDGKLTGIAVDLVEVLFERIDQPIEVTLLPWTRALKMTELGEADGIFTTFYSDERAQYLDYVKEPLAYEAQYIYHLATTDMTFRDSITGLSGYRIGIVQDYYLGEAFEKAKSEGVLQVEENTDIETNIQKLLDKKIDIMIDHRNSTLFRLKKLGLTEKIKESANPFRKPESLHLCFSKKSKVDETMMLRIEEELKAMKKDGTYQNIIDSYVK